MKNEGEKLSDNELYKLAKKGKKIYCPKCGAELTVIADRSGETIKLHSITCPVNSAHFEIHYMDTEKVQAIRRRMDERLMKSATDTKNK